MKRSCPMGTTGRRGFTMIEMLTVIAIIAILAGILFPVFSTVRKNVWKASCTTNLHSIAQGLKLYRDDHNGVYPDALYEFHDTASNKDVNGLYPQYVKTKQEFHCPLAPFHVDDAKAPVVLATPPTTPFVKYPKRIYPAWDSYDGQFDPPKNLQNYLVKYTKHWSTLQPGFSDIPRQLLYKNPPEDTVVTWCTYHRDYDSSGQPQTGSIDLVLFLDGHVKPTPSNQMFPIMDRGTIPANHSYLINRGD